MLGQLGFNGIRISNFNYHREVHYVILFNSCILELENIVSTCWNVFFSTPHRFIPHFANLLLRFRFSLVRFLHSLKTLLDPLRYHNYSLSNLLLMHTLHSPFDYSPLLSFMTCDITQILVRFAFTRP